MFKVELTDKLIQKHLEKNKQGQAIGVKITHKRFIQIDALREYRQIRMLNLSHCHLGSLASEIPNSCPFLAHLELQNDQIADCSFLRRLPYLEFLNLAENDVSSLEDFTLLQRLRHLDIRCN